MPLSMDSKQAATMQDNENIFIDFQIIKDSNLANLVREFDLLIRARRRIFVWSSKTRTEEMKSYCQRLVITMPKPEIEKHKECRRLKFQGSKTYKEISETLNIPISKVGFYINNSPDRVWTIDDWVVDYYKKDSSVYPKVDIVVDPSQTIVDKFKRSEKEAYRVEKIE